MKKKHVNEILINQTRRRNIVFMFSCLIFVIFLISLSFFAIFMERNKNYYVNYNESNNTKYRVYLKKNDFYKEPYLEEKNEYISAIIDYISANFKYSLSLNEDNVEYKYSYKIDADINVKRKNSDNYLYHDTVSLVEKKEVTTSNSSVNINESLKIDYNYYNNIIKNFINIYSLEDISSKMTVKMYISIIGSCENFDENANKESVITMDIPLASKVTNIELSDNFMAVENNVIQCKKIYDNISIFLIFGIFFLVLCLALIFITVRYVYTTRTAENIYEKELKKILNNYSSYIQKLNNDFNFDKYQLLKIDTFTDMLEIRDTIGQPILMKENEDKTGAYFVIPSASKYLYVYRLKVSDIKKEIKDTV